MNHLHAVALLAFLLGGTSQASPPVDLPRLVECRAEVGDFTRLAMQVGSDGKSMGWGG